MAKPTRKPNWTYTNAPARAEPTNQKKVDGWGADERPPFQFFNWLFYNISEWIDYLDVTTTAQNQEYDAIVGDVGTDPAATHSTLVAALAAVNPKSKILVKLDYVVPAVIQIAKNDVHIVFRPGITYSKGAATSALQISADRVMIEGGRFTGFNSGGDSGILIDSGADYANIFRNYFYDNTDDVVDNSGSADMLMNHNEN